MSSIYIIDDHAMFREGLGTVLGMAGHQVIGESDNPTEALADITRLKPSIALVDLNLGGRSGLEVIEQANPRRLSTKFIVMTMSDDPRHVAQALRMGCHGYVLKGASAMEIVGAIDAASNDRKYLCTRASELAVAGLSTDIDRLRIDALSVRERQVVQMVVRGGTSASIGKELHLSTSTIETYRSRVMKKLGVADIPALVRLAVREGQLSAED